MIKALTTYLLSAMLAWMPPRNQVHRETEEAALARYQTIAEDVATVCLDPDETPLFEGENARVKTALVLLSVAFWESAFRPDVDHGQCAPHECDNGLAVSLWQLHPEDGFIFDGDVYTCARNRSAAWRAEHAADIYGREELRGNRRLSARIALHILRYSMRNAKSLAIYTGEGGNGPKARTRLRHALDWYRNHHFRYDAAAE
jgi:hypothetical protein